MGEIKYRNLVVVVLLSIVTLGIYLVYWFVKTKEEMNSMGAQIPTAWLLVLFPIGTFYWVYKYAEGVQKTLDEKTPAVLWFWFFTSSGIFLVPTLAVQEKLNALAPREV